MVNDGDHYQLLFTTNHEGHYIGCPRLALPAPADAALAADAEPGPAANDAAPQAEMSPEAGLRTGDC